MRSWEIEGTAVLFVGKELFDDYWEEQRAHEEGKKQRAEAKSIAAVGQMQGCVVGITDVQREEVHVGNSDVHRNSVDVSSVLPERPPGKV